MSPSVQPAKTLCHTPEPSTSERTRREPLHAYDLSDNAFETKGTRQNDDRIFNLPFYGREIYFFLEFLERFAEQSTHIVNVRPAVLGAEMFRERAKKQGF